jgi:hypothetical protein
VPVIPESPSEILTSPTSDAPAASAEQAAPSSETQDTFDPDGTAFAQTSVAEVSQPTDAPAATAGQAAPSPEVIAFDAAEVAVAETGTDLPSEDATRAQGQATIAALDQWLDAIHVARAQRRP